MMLYYGMKIAKIESTGKIVQILKMVEHVEFSDERGWILIDPDLGKPDMGNSIGLNIRWIPADTRFTWVREISDTV